MRLAWIVTAGLLAGCAPEMAPVAAPAPAETVTVTAVPEPAPTVTVTVTEYPEPEPEPVDAVPVYVAPDPATVAQFIKSVFSAYLDRLPNQHEMQTHLAWYLDEHQYGGDTDARYHEMFEREYAAELQFLRDKEQAQQNRENWEESSNATSCYATQRRTDCDDD